MRRCRIVADAHNVMRRDAVCDVAALRFSTTNERTPQVHFLLHHHSRTVVPRSIVQSVQFRLGLDCAAVELGGLSHREEVYSFSVLEPRERSAQDKEIVANNYFGSSKWGGFAGWSTVLVRALALRG